MSANSCAIDFGISTRQIGRPRWKRHPYGLDRGTVRLLVQKPTYTTDFPVGSTPVTGFSDMHVQDVDYEDQGNNVAVATLQLHGLLFQPR